MRAVDQALPSCECSDWHGGGFDVRKLRWFRRNFAWFRDAIFSERAIGEPVVHPVNFLTDLKVGHVGADFGDDTTELMRRDRVGARRAVFRVHRGIPDQFTW